MDALCRRGGTARVSAVFLCRCRLVVLPGGALRVGLHVLGRCDLLGMGCRCATMMVRTAKRHGRGCGALSGNRQNQQPDQKRPNQQTYPSPLQQAAASV